MPERWERELRRPEQTTPPSSLDARVREGPRGGPAGLPPTRQRVVAAVVAFGVFAAAAVFAWQAFAPASTRSAPANDGVVPSVSPVPDPGSEEMVVEAHLGRDVTRAPEARVRFDGAEATVPPQGGSGFATAILGDDIGYALATTAVPQGTTLRVVSDAVGASILVIPCCPIERTPGGVPSEGAPTQLPSEPGEYLVELTLRWPEGTAVYTTFVRVKRPVDVEDRPSSLMADVLGLEGAPTSDGGVFDPSILRDHEVVAVALVDPACVSCRTSVSELAQVAARSTRDVLVVVVGVGGTLEDLTGLVPAGDDILGVVAEGSSVGLTVEAPIVLLGRVDYPGDTSHVLALKGGPSLDIVEAQAFDRSVEKIADL